MSTLHPTYEIGQHVTVGTGQILWKIEAIWAAGGGAIIASLERVGRPDVHTSVPIQRLKAVTS